MINSVRNAVLSILNKNNYGYISPSDFNLFALNAQLEIYEEYHSGYNKFINSENARLSGTDYADLTKQVAETIETFLVNDCLIPQLTANSQLTNNFFVPSLTTTGYIAYKINKVIVYTKQLKSGTNTSVVAFSLIDNTVNFNLLGISAGDVVVNSTTFKKTTVISIISNTELELNDDIFDSSGAQYSIYSASSYAEAEKVSNSSILLLANSSLTAPSLLYPAYSNAKDIMSVYPSSIKGYGAVVADYFRYPKAPKWTYQTLSGGEPVFDQTQPDYQDFEVNPSDEYKIVMKICEYCGISIRETEVAQFAIAQEERERPTLSMQQ